MHIFHECFESLHVISHVHCTISFTLWVPFIKLFINFISADLNNLEMTWKAFLLTNIKVMFLIQFPHSTFLLDHPIGFCAALSLASLSLLSHRGLIIQRNSLPKHCDMMGI